MTNRTNPRCREAFVATIESSGGNVDTAYTDYESAFLGFCLLWKPPCDVAPESVLGKLKQLVSTGHSDLGTFSGFVGFRSVCEIRDLIAVIETLQQKVESLEAEKGES